MQYPKHLPSNSKPQQFSQKFRQAEATIAGKKTKKLANLLEKMSSRAHNSGENVKLHETITSSSDELYDTSTI